MGESISIASSCILFFVMNGHSLLRDHSILLSQWKVPVLLTPLSLHTITISTCAHTLAWVSLCSQDVHGITLSQHQTNYVPCLSLHFLQQVKCLITHSQQGTLLEPRPSISFQLTSQTSHYEHWTHPISHRGTVSLHSFEKYTYKPRILDTYIIKPVLSYPISHQFSRTRVYTFQRDMSCPVPRGLGDHN